MKYVGQGTAWGIAQRLWVAVGLTLAAGCSSQASGELTGGNGGNGGGGGFGGSNVEIVDERDDVALPDSFDDTMVVAPPSTATVCTSPAQCATGNCVDGFCCDTKCDNLCMACSAAKKGSGVDGVCGSVLYDTDPDNDCPFGACNGKNQCKNYNGFACTAAAECLSNYCVDGFCCGNICMNECMACSAAKKGSGSNGVCGFIANGTNPDNECASAGTCNGTGKCSTSVTKQANGAACTTAAQCTSGFCADGVCCDSWCLGTCQACTAAKKFGGVDGVCGSIANDKDPDEECWGGACNGANVCKQYNGVPCTNKTQCLSNYCVDGFCCGNICNLQCYACSESLKGQGVDGVCGPIASGRDIQSECNPGECNGSGGCTQPQAPQGNGTACVSGGQCATGNCVDGVCCDTACAGTCQACTAAKKGQGANGICGPIGSELDPDVECNGGKCDGKGVCRYYNGAPCTSTGQCFSNYCVDGYCCGNICTGACEACSAAKKGGSNGVCGAIPSGTDPDNECNPGECNGARACNQAQSQQPNGAACTQSTQCTSGFCVDGVCCDSACPGNCVACTAAKKGQGANGTCGYIITGTDPDNECTNSDCNGSGGCTNPTNLPNGSACNASTQCASGNCVDSFCCDTACDGVCVACSAAKKGSGSNGVCGSIKYDTDPDDECNIGGCNGQGGCGYYNGVPCNVGTQCLSSYCVDGVCCNNHCGGTCYACTAAKKGSGGDGQCAFIKANFDPDNECNPGVCNGAGVCSVPTCTSSTDCGTHANCSNSACVCDTGYSGDGYTCTDIDECQTNNGGCDTHATCTNTAGSRTCACNTGYSGDGLTCTDIDECQTNNGGCDVNATCTNTDGSRTCACNTGYSGDGETCTFTGQITNLWVNSDEACAKADDGRVKCWGTNASGSLGIGTTDPHGVDVGQMGNNLPVLDLGTGKIAMRIGILRDAACAVLNDGNVKCWGSSFFGQLGIETVGYIGDGPGEMGDTLAITNLGTGRTASAVSGGQFHACAILDNNSVKCWGFNPNGELGQGDTAIRGDSAGTMGDNLLPIDLGTGRTAMALASGQNHTCAILDNSTVKCWGDNTNGNLGLGDANDRGDAAGEMGDMLPTVDLGTGLTAMAIAAGHNHTCALLNDGNVKCWGANTYGQLGIGSIAIRGIAPNEMGDNLPTVDLGMGLTAVAISAGGNHTCALLSNGTAKCWGDNTWGQLGQGDMNARGDGLNEMGDNLLAIDLGAGRMATSIRLGAEHTCALLDNGTVKCWGHGNFGQLGYENAVTRGDGPNEMGDNLPTVSIF